MRVFLSHSSKDTALVREIRQSLPEHVRTWIDEQSLLIGDDIEASTRDVIGTQIDLVIIFIGRDSVKSAWVRKELKWALKRESKLGHSFVLPVALDSESWELVEPAKFRGRKYLECYDHTAAGIRAVAGQLQEVLFAWASRE